MRKIFKKVFNPESLPKILFILSLCVLSFAYGYLSLAGGLFPHGLITEAVAFFIDDEKGLPWYYIKTEATTKIPIYEKDSAYNGLSLMTSIAEDRLLAASVINMNGELIHRWDLDWFEIWPEVTHIPKTDHQYPHTRPGTFLQGAVLLENGDLIYNYTYLGLVRVDVCGNVIWRLPYRTHHSVYLDEYGILWVPGQIKHEEAVPDLPYHVPDFYEFTVLKVSLDGEILEEFFVFDILKKNDLHGLIGLLSNGNRIVSVTGDTLHLNDVETFPSSLEEGVFKAGDIMLSLRNINTILIFREEDLKVTHVSTGTYVRQHDPDFIDGDTISVFDNYNIGPEEYGHQSRIVIESFDEDQHYTYFYGTEEQPFYTDVQGNHQWLPNGNLLITESRKARAFEIDTEGNIVWEYINLVEDEKAGIIDNMQRIPKLFTEEYFNQLVRSCDVDITD